MAHTLSRSIHPSSPCRRPTGRCLIDRWRIGLKDLLERLYREVSGMAVMELAVILPIILTLLLAGVDVTRLILINQKADRAAATLADLVSQSEVITEAGMEDLFEAATWVLEPYPADPNAAMIVTSVMGDNGPRIVWQRHRNASANDSAIGRVGGSAALPPGFVMRDNDNVIVVELLYDYEPIFVRDIFVPRTLSKRAYFRPRFAVLDRVEP